MSKPTLTKQYRKSKLARLVVPLVTCGFLAYFAMHAQSGRYGLEAKQDLMSSLAASQKRYDDLRRKRENLEHQVELLRDGTLDRDLIDERCRQALNYATPNEIVVMK